VVWLIRHYFISVNLPGSKQLSSPPPTESVTTKVLSSTLVYSNSNLKTRSPEPPKETPSIDKVERTQAKPHKPHTVHFEPEETLGLDLSELSDSIASLEPRGCRNLGRKEAAHGERRQDRQRDRQRMKRGKTTRSKQNDERLYDPSRDTSSKQVYSEAGTCNQLG